MDLRTINSTISVGSGVTVDVRNAEVGDNVVIEDGVRIQAETLRLGDGVRIGCDVTIRAESIEIGAGARLEPRCVIAALGGAAKVFHLGEQSLIAHDTKILTPAAVVGDYTTIHNHTLCNGRKPLLMGHNCWVGQNCVLNSEDDLTIGNNVGIGAYSSVYTHGYFGDMLEGCNVFKIGPVTLADDVWILGSYNIISPGVTIGEKALVLTGSNVTRDVPANHTVGGAPARDMTDRLVPYRSVTAEEKLERMRGFVTEFLDAFYPGKYDTTNGGFDVDAENNRFRIRFEERLTERFSASEDCPVLIFTPADTLDQHPPFVSVFDLANRTYSRARTRPEIQLMSFLKSYRARFVPREHPVVRMPEFAESAAETI